MSTASSPVLLKVEGLSKRFSLHHGLFSHSGPVLTAIEDISFTVESGQVHGLVGESGSGKSTLGRAILQLIRPDSGKVLFHGQDLCLASRRQLRRTRKNIQVIFQDSLAALSPRRTVAQTLLEPLDQFALGDRSQRREKCDKVLETVGLDRSVLARLPHQLSSGQRQRICIARAVLTDPDLIIADEAVSALDVSVQAQVLELIRKLQSERGIAFIFISHDLSIIPQVADLVSVMFQGQIVESAPVDSLFSQPSHPYTQELLAAIPDPDPSVTMSVVDVNAGLSRESRSGSCVFADRCSRLMPHCRKAEPKTMALENQPRHHVKCHLFSEKNAE